MPEHQTRTEVAQVVTTGRALIAAEAAYDECEARKDAWSAEMMRGSDHPIGEIRRRMDKFRQICDEGMVLLHTRQAAQTRLRDAVAALVEAADAP